MATLTPGGAGLTAPSRRPSRLNMIGQTGPHVSSSVLSPVQEKGYPKYPSNGPTSTHRVPLHLRIPGLFRTRIPLIAVLPFFLLGYLFAPVQHFDPEQIHASKPPSSTGSAAPESPQNRLISYQQGKEWAQRFIYPSQRNTNTFHGEPEEHFTDKDGLLYFPPVSTERATEGVELAYAALPPQRHPILHLIEKAEQDWENLLERQSSTLTEAVAEYKHRYNRAPPKGFDAWFKFATSNNIQLVDEYDAIMTDIEPFFALPPRLLNARAYQMAHDPNFHVSQQSFTMNIKEGQLEMTGPLAQSGRAEETRALLDGIAKYLPDMQATFTGHDGPGIFLSGEKKQKYIEYARSGKYFTEAEAEETGDQAEHHGWSGACPPGSNWRKSLYGTDLVKPSTHSFISNVDESCDVCKHPDVATQHGFFGWTGPFPSLLYPLFTWAKTAVHSDLLVTPLEQYHLQVGPDPKWEDKFYNKLLWRGSTTGAAFNRDSHWRSSQRSRLVLLANETEGHRTVHWADKDGVLRATEEPLSDLNERFLDVAFTGRPAQCNNDDGTCEAMARVFDFKRGMDQEEANQYRYIFDMDGNGWSGRFHRLLMSNSAILKSTIMPEWYQQRIMPWVHYIPVKVDYTDLYDILAFFIGGPDGRNGHDALGNKIAKQGQEWAKHHWREVDMQAYLFRLFLEYSRLLQRTEAEPTRADYNE